MLLSVLSGGCAHQISAQRFLLELDSPEVSSWQYCGTKKDRCYFEKHVPIFTRRTYRVSRAELIHLQVWDREKEFPFSRDRNDWLHVSDIVTNVMTKWHPGKRETEQTGSQGQPQN